MGLGDVEIPHVNRSVRRPYAEYDDGEAREIVARRYAEDVREFGYRFD